MFSHNYIRARLTTVPRTYSYLCIIIFGVHVTEQSSKKHEKAFTAIGDGARGRRRREDLLSRSARVTEHTLVAELDSELEINRDTSSPPLFSYVVISFVICI